MFCVTSIKHKGTVTINTPRLVLRRLTEEDAQNMYNNWASDEKVPKYLSWNIHESVETTRELLATWVAEYEKPEHYQWVIEYDGAIVGTVGLHAVSDKHERCEMGYNIGSKWWNKGIVTEAVGAVINFVFTELNMNKVCALHDTENIGSGRVMQKNGMKQEGLLYEHSVRKDGTRGNLAYYAIIKSEWKNYRGNIYEH